jgi:hypothetical protein
VRGDDVGRLGDLLVGDAPAARQLLAQADIGVCLANSWHHVSLPLDDE